MDLSNLISSQRETKSVRFPSEWFEGVLSSYRTMGSGEAQIDLLEVERFLIHLIQVEGLQKKRLVVFDEGASICMMEQVKEGENARVKYTPIEGPGISGKPKAVLVYLARKKMASIEQLAEGVWYDAETKRNTILTTISQLSQALRNNQFGIDIGKEQFSENYRIFF